MSNGWRVLLTITGSSSPITWDVLKQTGLSFLSPSCSAASLPFGLSLVFAPIGFRTWLTTLPFGYPIHEHPFVSDTAPRAAQIPHPHPSKEQERQKNASSLSIHFYISTAHVGPVQEPVSLLCSAFSPAWGAQPKAQASPSVTSLQPRDQHCLCFLPHLHHFFHPCLYPLPNGTG